MYYTYLVGRNRTATERTGKLIHAVLGSGEDYPSFAKALCGAQPGHRSNGWSEYRAEHATCPKCLKVLAKIQTVAGDTPA